MLVVKQNLLILQSQVLLIFDFINNQQVNLLDFTDRKPEVEKGGASRLLQVNRSNREDNNHRPSKNNPNGNQGGRTNQGSKKGRSSSRKSGNGGGQNSQASARIIEAVERAEQRFSINPKPLGFPEEFEPPNEVSVNWKTTPIKQRTERQACDLVMIPGEWGFLDDDAVEGIGDRLKTHNMSVDQGLSLRKALMQEKAVYGHYKMMNKSNTFLKRYENGESVLQLSRRFDFPPVAIFRSILTARGWSKVKIRDSLRSPKKLLSTRDAEEFQKAEEKDRVTNVDQGETAVRADLFEVVVEKYLDTLGIKYRRQEELLKEQQKEHGRPLNTPDFLIMDKLTINGKLIAWIDAKNFYGANVSFAKKKTKKQMNRYIDEWGAGAIVYRHGFCDGMLIPGVLMLDQTPLDITIMYDE